MTNKFVKITSLCVTVALCVAFVGNGNVHKSAGAPVYVTNAPGEQTCSGAEGTNPCHGGGIPDNSGPGTPSILFSGGTIYVPGQTYTVTPQIYHPTRNRFGFEIVSLKDSNNANAGAITLIDPNGTQTVQPTTGSFLDRIYVTHQLMGTYPTTNHLGQWTYKWTAPTYNAGNISFYACYNAANNNNTNDAGDETYYAKITVTPSAVGVTPISENKISLSVYPNPANEMITVEFTDLKTQSIAISLMDVQGKIVKKVITQNSKEIIETTDLENGAYSVVITENQKTLSIKKIVVQH